MIKRRLAKMSKETHIRLKESRPVGNGGSIANITMIAHKHKSNLKQQILVPIYDNRLDNSIKVEKHKFPSQKSHTNLVVHPIGVDVVAIIQR